MEQRRTAYFRRVTLIRIATFNLLHGQPLDAGGAPLPFPPDPAAAGDGRSADAGGPLAEAVAALDADVLALQEVDRYQERSGLVDQTTVAAKALGAADWRFAAAVHGRPAPVSGWVPDPAADHGGLRVYGPAEVGHDLDAPAYGTALLTRLPVRHWRARRFAPAPFGLPLRVAGRRGLTQVPDEPRTILAAVLDGPSGPFTVVAAHLSFVPGWNMGQLAGIRRWIADLPAPYLLLGDFNLVGAVPRTVLGGASVVARVSRADTPRPRLPYRPALRPVLRPVLRPRRTRGAAAAVQTASAAQGAQAVQAAQAAQAAQAVQAAQAAHGQRAFSRRELQGWRDLARTPTYPSHRPTVQFDHVLAVGVPRGAVESVGTPAVGVSDHRPLLVTLRLPGS